MVDKTSRPGRSPLLVERRLGDCDVIPLYVARDQRQDWKAHPQGDSFAYAERQTRKLIDFSGLREVLSPAGDIVSTKKPSWGPPGDVWRYFSGVTDGVSLDHWQAGADGVDPAANPNLITFVVGQGLAELVEAYVTDWIGAQLPLMVVAKPDLLDPPVATIRLAQMEPTFDEREYLRRMVRTIAQLIKPGTLRTVRIRFVLPFDELCLLVRDAAERRQIPPARCLRWFMGLRSHCEHLKRHFKSLLKEMLGPEAQHVALQFDGELEPASRRLIEALEESRVPSWDELIDVMSHEGESLWRTALDPDARAITKDALLETGALEELRWEPLEELTNTARWITLVNATEGGHTAIAVDSPGVASWTAGLAEVLAPSIIRTRPRTVWVSPSPKILPAKPADRGPFQGHNSADHGEEVLCSLVSEVKDATPVVFDDLLRSLSPPPPK